MFRCIAGLIIAAISLPVFAHGFSSDQLNSMQDRTVLIEFKHSVAQGTMGKHCTGVYLGDRWVLTVAHCFLNRNKNKLSDLDIWAVMSKDQWLRRQYNTGGELVKYIDGTLNGVQVDLGLIRTDEPITGVATADVSCDKPTVGQQIAVVGHPATIRWSATPGTIATTAYAANRRSVQEGSGEIFVATTARGPGGSGSPIFNASGEVIGILSEEEIATAGGELVQIGVNRAASGAAICDFLGID